MKQQTSAQRQTVIRTFLESKKFRVFNAIEARNLMVEEWGLYYDWHDFASELIQMECIGLATVTKAGGYTEYIIEPSRRKLDAV